MFSIVFINSINLAPDVFCIFKAICITLSINSTTFIKSFSLNPRVVKAGVPILIPHGLNADLSPATEFLFIDISTYSHIFSILLPVIFNGFKSINIK